MSTFINFELKELRKLASDKNSCVIEKNVVQNLTLQPWCLGNLKESIKNLQDYKIGKFDKELNGILLSYKNLRVLSNVGSIRNDSADIQFQVQADYFIFQPFVGATLKGIVNKKSHTHLGVLVHRVFNVVIPRPTEEPGNEWIGSGVQEGQEVIFRVMMLDLYGALPYIRGELDERCIHMGPDGDDEMVETKHLDPLSVTYVNFDKTKPHQKQTSDGLVQSSSKNSIKNSIKRRILEKSQKEAENTSREEISSRNVSDWIKKNKKNSKGLNGDPTANPGTVKKHKRES